MANPKRKWSKARTGKRRSQWKLSVPNYVECPKCHLFKMPHKVCLECGFYNNVKVIEIKTKIKK